MTQLSNSKLEKTDWNMIGWFFIWFVIGWLAAVVGVLFAVNIFFI